MDLRLSFNEDVKNYDKWRPRYTPALFRSIIDFAGLNSVSRALEIGIGTGQATQPFLETGCHVTAIELGSDLAQYTRNKFRSYPNLEVLQKDFEQYESKKNQFDLVYSGTAFHWIPAETGYSKAFGLLKPGGTLALFWNHPFVSRTDDPLHQKIRAAYRRHRLPTIRIPPNSACRTVKNKFALFASMDLHFVSSLFSMQSGISARKAM